MHLVLCLRLLFRCQAIAVKVNLLYNLQALPNLQNLEVLNFGDCLVRTKGAEAIADAIKDSHTNLKVRIFSYKCRGYL